MAFTKSLVSFANTSPKLRLDAGYRSGKLCRRRLFQSMLSPPIVTTIEKGPGFRRDRRLPESDAGERLNLNSIK